ncbi:GIY-YIG nuclease family protein [Paenibacillus silvae]|uniref:GIY-YIG nuclease family protein n=1 Tax=Paenibacillus silvae TaxID=1325358 RepID=UPI003CE7204F
MESICAFNLGCEYQLPELPGVYAIKDINTHEVLYIGRTLNLRLRFKNHLKESHNWRLRRRVLGNEGLTFSYELTISQKEMIDKEKKYIRSFEPTCNEVRYINH